MSKEVRDLDKELYDRVWNFIRGSREEPLTIKRQIKNLISSQMSIDSFSTPELNWLQQNIHFIPKIAESKVASSIIYLLNRDSGLNFYQVAFRLGKYYSVVNHWKKKLAALDMIENANEGSNNLKYWKTENMYYLKTETYPNIFKLLLLLLQNNYGERILKELTTKDVQLNREPNRKTVKELRIRRRTRKN